MCIISLVVGVGCATNVYLENVDFRSPNTSCVVYFVHAKKHVDCSLFGHTHHIPKKESAS